MKTRIHVLVIHRHQGSKLKFRYLKRRIQILEAQVEFVAVLVLWLVGLL